MTIPIRYTLNVRHHYAIYRLLDVACRSIAQPVAWLNDGQIGMAVMRGGARSAGGIAARAGGSRGQPSPPEEVIAATLRSLSSIGSSDITLHAR